MRDPPGDKSHTQWIDCEHRVDAVRYNASIFNVGVFGVSAPRTAVERRGRWRMDGCSAASDTWWG